MNTINQLIFNELARFRRVILPGLGTLSTERDPAQALEGALAVPRTRVAFGPEEEGETLINLIANRLGVTPKEVRPQYHGWLSELKKDSPDGTIALDGIATIRRRPDGSHAVHPSEALERLLNPMTISEIKIPELKPVKGRKSKSGARAQARQKTRSVWWVVFGLLTAIFVGEVWYGYAHGHFDPLIERVFPKKEVAEAPVPTVSAAPAEPLPQTEPVGEPLVEPLPGMYYLIAGVFSTRENAERFVREGGFDAAQTAILPTAAGRFQVSTGQYATQEEADRAAAALRAKYPDVWVLKP